jgi:DNA-binding PadR family transcriptional regulator
METASAKDLFILGRVSLRPTHGHEIMRTLRASRADLWVELSEKHVYYVLRKLERDGLVSVAEERVGNLPARKVYSITGTGRATLAEMMEAESLVQSMPHSDFDVLFGMLCYTDALDETARTAVLVRRRDVLEALLADLRSASTDSETGRHVAGAPLVMLDRIARGVRAELEWLADTMQTIECDGWAAMRPLFDTPKEPTR